jgi:hypothetical protein
MDPLNVFQIVADVFKQAGAISVLIGGFAVNYYKVSRQTADADFMIDEEAFPRIRALMEKKGFITALKQNVFAQMKPASPGSLMDVDFMFVDKKTLDQIVNAGRNIKIADCEFIVPSLMHLIALKLHSIKHNSALRENRDLPDIIELIRQNGLKTDDAEFRELCIKYGTWELYGKILEQTG